MENEEIPAEKLEEVVGEALPSEDALGEAGVVA